METSQRTIGEESEWLLEDCAVLVEVHRLVSLPTKQAIPVVVLVCMVRLPLRGDMISSLGARGGG